MGQPCLPGAEPADVLQRATDTQMGRVRRVAQRIYDQDVQVSEHLEAFRGNRRDVRAERDIPDAKSQHRESAVQQSQRQYLQSQQLKRDAGTDGFEPQPWRGEFMRMCDGVCERIGKRLAELRLNRFFAVQGNRVLQAEAKNSQVVQPHDMIGVRVGEDSRTHQAGLGTDELQPEFGARIDHEFPQWSADQHAGARPLIPGIRGSADRAVAAGDGYSHARARSHHDQFDCRSGGRGRFQRGQRGLGWRAGVTGTVGQQHADQFLSRQSVLRILLSCTAAYQTETRRRLQCNPGQPATAAAFPGRDVHTDQTPPRAMTSENSLRLPHILFFSTLRNWLRLLARYHGQIDRRHWPLAVAITLFVAATLPCRLLESLLTGRAVRRHRLQYPPLFIVGHWRSGTTNLHNHLLQDPAFASVTLLHCAIPTGFLTWGWLARLIMNPRLPRSRPMDAVPLGVDEPMSEDFALAGMTHMSHYLNYFFPQIAEQTFRETVLFEDVPESDLRHWRKSWMSLLQKVSFAAGGRRLLLKNPANLGRIRELLQLFPEAKFIHVVRNPWLVHASSVRLMERFVDEMAFHSCPRSSMEQFVSARYALIMQRWRLDRIRIPPENLIELRHEEITSDGVAAIARIYLQFGLPDWDRVRPRIEAYVNSQRNYRNNTYEFDAQQLAAMDPYLRESGDGWGYQPPAPTPSPGPSSVKP